MPAGKWHCPCLFSTESHCQQDTPSPTTAPPAPPSTSSPSPPPKPESPSVSRYNVSSNNETCLLASMGLQLNVTYVLRDNTVGIQLLVWGEGSSLLWLSSMT